MTRALRFLSTLFFAFLTTTALAGPLSGTKYYMVMLAADGSPSTARTSHTFATFVREDNGVRVDERTISWLPQPGYFGPGFSMPPLAIVPGRNYSLDETAAMSHGRHVVFWGPYEISPQLYQRAMSRWTYLSNGLTSYKMMNLFRGGLRDAPLRNLPGGAVNCIMAVSDIGGYLDTGTAWGASASGQVLSFLSPGLTFGYTARQDVAARMNLLQRIGR